MKQSEFEARAKEALETANLPGIFSYRRAYQLGYNDSIRDINSLSDCSKLIEVLILNTPSGELRNKLCDINILLLSINN